MRFSSHSYNHPVTHCTIIALVTLLIPNQHIVHLHCSLAKTSSFRGIALRDEQLMNRRRRTGKDCVSFLVLHINDSLTRCRLARVIATVSMRKCINKLAAPHLETCLPFNRLFSFKNPISLCATPLAPFPETAYYSPTRCF